MPTKEQVRAALNKVQRRADYEFLFANLKSPDWLDPLDENDQFSNPDAPIREGDSIRFPFWPPARYLVRVSEQAPEKVLKIILNVPDTENSRVHEDFVEAALKMPPGVAVKLVDSVTRWLQSPDLQLFLLADKAASYILHLRSGGFSKESLSVADALLAIRKRESKVPETDTFVRRADPIVRSEWEYNEILGEISPSFQGEDRLKLIELLCHKLRRAILIEEHDDESGFRDLSHIWRGSIEGSDQNHEYGTKDTLINWIRDLSEQVSSETPERTEALVHQLRGGKFPIFSRFALYIARKSKRVDLIRSLLLDPTLFECIDAWHEYSDLLREGFPILAAEEQRKLLDMIAAHICPSNIGKNPSDVDESANERSRYFYYFVLRDHLGGPEKELLDRLRTRYGDLENPSFHSYSTSWVGPTSPKSVGDLKGMTLNDLQTFLGAWKPTKEFFGPSMEGLGRELEQVVTDKYAEFSEHLSLFKFAEKTYVRSIIQGLSKAAANSSSFQWEPVLDYLLWACGNIDSSPDAEFNPGDQKDPTWGWSRQAACRLIETGLTSKSCEIPFQFRNKVWAVLAFGLSDANPQVEKESQYASDKDYFQLALNSVRGEALDSVIHYGFWVKRKLEISEGDLPVDQCPEFFSALDKHLDLDFEKSKAVRAMYGRWIPWLRSLNKEWFKKNADNILPKEARLQDFWAAAWNAYICFNPPYIDLFQELQDHYALAIDRLELGQKDFLKKTGERLIDHFIVLYLYGAFGAGSEIIEKLYSKIDLKFRRQAIRFIGSALSNRKRPVEKEVVDRSVEFWRYRVDACNKEPEIKNRIELSEFGWWMESSALSDEWVLEQARTTLSLAHSITPDNIVLDRLVSLSEKFPTSVAEVFRLIVEYRVSDYGFYGWLEKALVLLPNLLKSDARDPAIKIIHKLGAFGFNQFKALLPKSPS